MSNYEIELNILEILEANLNTSRLEAVKNGQTDLAIMIHKFREQTRERIFDVKANKLMEAV
jgi:hypothetical protein